MKPIRGRKGVQHIAETNIVLDRPAARKVNGKTVYVPGEALELCLIIARVYDSQTNELLSTWYVLSNVPTEVAGSQIALWYYYRWDIESYFKLMKSGGHELEHWQQESGVAILKRLLVASMASATVWSLQALDTQEAEEFKQALAKLSGKSRKRGRPPTSGVLLSGLFVLLRIFDFLKDMNFDLAKITQLQQTLAKLAPNLRE